MENELICLPLRVKGAWLAKDGRFELVLYQIKLGTVDMVEAENEWVLRPYMNTARKRKAL